MAKHFRLISIITFLSIIAMPSTISAQKIEQLKDRYEKYNKSMDIESKLNMLNGETIRFSDFSPYEKITAFISVVPDTLWIKKKPKKNPVEGKHYKLRWLYHGEGEGINYATPKLELIGVPFQVQKYDIVTKRTVYNSTETEYQVYLKNLLTDEELIWIIPKQSYKRVACNLRLENLKNKLSLNGKEIYSAYNSGTTYSPNYTDIRKHTVTDTEVIMDFKHDNSGVTIIYTLADDIGTKSTLKFGEGSRSVESRIYFEPSQLSIIEDANRAYEIDYTTDLSAIGNEFPFSFKFIQGTVDGYYTEVGQEIQPGRGLANVSHLSSGQVIFIGDRLTVRDTKYYKGVVDGKPFYIPASKVKLEKSESEKLDSLLACDTITRNSFFETAKALSYAGYLNRLQSVLKEFNKMEKAGLAIPEWQVYDMSEYTQGTGLRITFYNPTKVMIKYITLSFQGYNPVDDRVGGVITKRCVGPIDPDTSAEYEFDYVWFTDLVEYAKLKSIMVEYKNGTKRTITNPASIEWEVDYTELLKRELESLKSELVNANQN